ncbi:hypothetical protein IWQ62_000543 [Dispira parvispora]|uniref:Uncharacterized protein n=1 Tax=Dispira parvispora TaxID=1520584 RepID=A0A9W8AVP1_9FUNG|nr:hypothetical protein IWQ62_000543 [Dispira parvispora]
MSTLAPPSSTAPHLALTMSPGAPHPPAAPREPLRERINRFRSTQFPQLYCTQNNIKYGTFFRFHPPNSLKPNTAPSPVSMTTPPFPMASPSPLATQEPMVPEDKIRATGPNHSVVITPVSASGPIKNVGTNSVRPRGTSSVVQPTTNTIPSTVRKRTLPEDSLSGRPRKKSAPSLEDVMQEIRLVRSPRCPTPLSPTLPPFSFLLDNPPTSTDTDVVDKSRKHLGDELVWSKSLAMDNEDVRSPPYHPTSPNYTCIPPELPIRHSKDNLLTLREGHDQARSPTTRARPSAPRRLTVPALLVVKLTLPKLNNIKTRRSIPANITKDDVPSGKRIKDITGSDQTRRRVPSPQLSHETLDRPSYTSSSSKSPVHRTRRSLHYGVEHHRDSSGESRPKSEKTDAPSRSTPVTSKPSSDNRVRSQSYRGSVESNGTESMPRQKESSIRRTRSPDRSRSPHRSTRVRVDRTHKVSSSSADHESSMWSQSRSRGEETRRRPRGSRSPTRTPTSRRTTDATSLLRTPQNTKADRDSSHWDTRKKTEHASSKMSEEEDTERRSRRSRETKQEDTPSINRVSRTRNISSRDTTEGGNQGRPRGLKSPEPTHSVNHTDKSSVGRDIKSYSRPLDVADLSRPNDIHSSPKTVTPQRFSMKDYQRRRQPTVSHPASNTVESVPEPGPRPDSPLNKVTERTLNLKRDTKVEKPVPRPSERTVTALERVPGSLFEWARLYKRTSYNNSSKRDSVSRRLSVLQAFQASLAFVQNIDISCAKLPIHQSLVQWQTLQEYAHFVSSHTHPGDYPMLKGLNLQLEAIIHHRVATLCERVIMDKVTHALTSSDEQAGESGLPPMPAAVVQTIKHACQNSNQAKKKWQESERWVGLEALVKDFPITWDLCQTPAVGDTSLARYPASWRSMVSLVPDGSLVWPLSPYSSVPDIVRFMECVLFEFAEQQNLDFQVHK